MHRKDALPLSALRRQTTIPIATGQHEGYHFRHRELLVHQAVDFLQPNVLNGGGYTECTRVTALAQAFNIPIANGGAWPHHNMHRQAGMANGTRVEFHYLAWMLGEAIFKDPPRPEKGCVTLPEPPGVGAEAEARDLAGNCGCLEYVAARLGGHGWAALEGGLR